MKKSLLSISLILILSGCQYLGIVQEVIENNPDLFRTPTPTATATATATPTVPTVPTVKPTHTPFPTPVAVDGNPVCGSKELPSRMHLLWKPVSDTSGNAVMVFDGKYKEEFTEVTVQLKAGGTESAFWKGLQLWGNPDRVGPRQHWRLRRKCAEYKDNGLIIAKDSKQTCVFKLEGTSCRRIE